MSDKKTAPTRDEIVEKRLKKVEAEVKADPELAKRKPEDRKPREAEISENSGEVGNSPAPDQMFFGVMRRKADDVPVLRLGNQEMAEFVDDAEPEEDAKPEPGRQILTATQKAQLVEQAIQRSVQQTALEAQARGLLKGIDLVLDAFKNTGLKADYAALKRVKPIVEALRRYALREMGIELQTQPDPNQMELLKSEDEGSEEIDEPNTD